MTADREHPRIVRVDDFGSDAARGLHWLRMEYVGGVDAAPLLGACGVAVSLSDLARLSPEVRLPEALVGRVLFPSA